MFYSCSCCSQFYLLRVDSNLPQVLWFCILVIILNGIIIPPDLLRIRQRYGIVLNKLVVLLNGALPSAPFLWMALLLICRLLLPATWSRSTATVKLGHNLFPRPTEDKPASKTDRRRERGKSSEKRPNCQLNIYTIQRSLGVENRHRQLRVHHLADRIGMRRCSRRMVWYPTTVMMTPDGCL